jgi:hypothetical protein
MGPYHGSSCKQNNEIITTYECFGTMAQLLRPTKRAKQEHLSSITIGYLILRKDSENTDEYKD